MDRTKSGSNFQKQNPVACESCKGFFAENNEIIENLRKDLGKREEKVQKLEEEAVKQTVNLEHVLEEKALLEDLVNKLKIQLENQQSAQVHKEGSSIDSQTTQVLQTLQDQLQGLEDEKGRLNETIGRFEYDSEELTNMFSMQRDKFELEVANKERVIGVLEKERELMEKDSKYNREELEKTRSTNQNIRKQTEQLKLSIQEKDAAIVNLSDLHNAALKQTNELHKELILSEESLKSELSLSKEITEKMLTNEKQENTLLDEEIQQLTIELKNHKENYVKFKVVESQMLKEVERVKELVENLETEKKEKEKDLSEVENFNSKLRYEKENVEIALKEEERKADELEMNLHNLRNENLQVQNEKNSLETMVQNFESEIKYLNETRINQEKEMSNLHMCLEETEQSLETKTTENIEVEENVQALKMALDKLKYSGGRQKKLMETTKEELDALVSDKQSLLLDHEKLKDNNRLLKEKFDTLSKEIESLLGTCVTKTTQNEHLEDVLSQKTRIIVSLQEQEQKLQSDMEELLGNEASSGIELNNIKYEYVKLQQEYKTIQKMYEKVNFQLQECLGLLQDKREEYMTDRNRMEEELRRQTEETSSFRDQNAEISKDLRNQSEEIMSLTMEKEEMNRHFDIKLETAASVENRLVEEINLLKQRLEQGEKDIRLVMEKQVEIKRELVDTKRKLETKDEEKKDAEITLTVAQEDVGRWKKVGQEVKEERDRLQMQIEELDRNLNEKHLYFTEEKSSLEKDTESLRNVVRRLKSNEERLRSKIEELRDEIGKLSDIKSEQQSQIRRLVHAKNQMADTIADHGNIVEEHALLQKDLQETRRENAELRKEGDGLHERTTASEQETKRLGKELQECQSLLSSTQAQVKETSQQCKELRNESGTLRSYNAENQEEKQRLFNENCRLKEKRNSMIQERNRLQDMIESLDKCHSEKYENLTRKNASLEKELTSVRQTMKNFDEKERRLLKEKKELNEKLQEAMSVNEEIQGVLNKANIENKRLMKKLGEMVKEVEQVQLENQEKMCMEINLQEKEECIKKMKHDVKVLNTLIIRLNQQQNQGKDELKNRERELNEAKGNIETERTDKVKFKEVTRRLNEELRAAKSREVRYIEEIQDEKDKNGQSDLLILKLEKEREDCKELYERNSVKQTRKLDDMDEEKNSMLKMMTKLDEDNVLVKLCNDDLISQIKDKQEGICLLAAENTELERKSKKLYQEKLELANEINTLQKENQSLRKHADNLEKVFSSTNSAMSDQTSGMEKEIQVLRDTLVQVRGTEETNRREIEQLKGRIENEKNEKMDVEVKVNEFRLKQERLVGKNDELLSNCARLEEMVNEGVELKLEKESKEQAPVVSKQRQEALEIELEGKALQLAEQNTDHENLKREISKCNESVQKLKNTKEELLASKKELEEKNERILEELNSINENYELMSSERQRLLELVTFHEGEIETLKQEVYGTKSELQLTSQEAESKKSQLEYDLNTKEEALARMAEKQQKLQDDLRNVKEETEDLENENEDLLAEVDQSKEEFKKVKDILCALRVEHGDLQEELRAKLNSWSEKTDQFNLEKFEIESEITSLKEKLAHSHERIEKQREMEKVLREEIEELSDAYVKLEEEIHHVNKENLLLKEKVEELSQNVEELELARETASLLKEKRHSDLLKSERIVQRLEKTLREKQKTNKKLLKELDAMIEKQKFQELKLISEKDINGQRLEQLQDLQNSQRNLEEQLWSTKTHYEKFDAEIETWQLNSDSMKLRIEALEEELKNTTAEKDMMVELYEDVKKGKFLYEEEANRKVIEITQQKNLFEERVCEISEDRDSLEEETKRLVDIHNRQQKEITDLNNSHEDVVSKYECVRILIAVLHNDIKQKDEEIEKLEKRKKQMINLLCDLDLKIAEIQVQAVCLERESNNLREKLSRVVSTNERLKETVKYEAKQFSKKLELEKIEKQQMNNTIEYLNEDHLNMETQLQDRNIENGSLLESKKNLEADVEQKALAVDSLNQILNVERNKTLTLKDEMSSILEECQALKSENIGIIEKEGKTKCELEKAKAKCAETEGRLEDKSVDLDKTNENLRTVRIKVKEQEAALACTTMDHCEILKSKDDIIESVTKQNHNLEKMVDSLTSNMHQYQAENAKNEIERKHVEEIVTRKQQLVDDLQQSHEKMVNMKKSLELETKVLSSKLREISKALAKLEFDHERSLLENENLHSENVNRELESSKRCNELLKEKQMLEEELDVLKTKSTNVNAENNILRERIEVGSDELEKTINSLNDFQEKMNNQQRENEILKKDLRESNFERNNLDDINQRVSLVLLKLKNETAYASNKNHLEVRENSTTETLDKETLESKLNELDKEALLEKVDLLQEMPREISELETSASLIVSEVLAMRNALLERYSDISSLKVSLDSLQNEKERLNVELARHVKRYEQEHQHREGINESFQKIKHDFENFRKEKEDIIRNLQSNNTSIINRNAAMEQEIECFKENNLAMENQRKEIEERIRNLQHEILAKEKELRCSKETIVSCKEDIVCLEKKNSDLRDRNQKIKELIAKYEEEREDHLNEIQNLQELWKENLKQLQKLENGFHVFKKVQDDRLQQGENGIDLLKEKDTFKDENLGSEKEEKEKFACLISRFNALNETNAFQFEKMEKLQEQQDNAQKQWVTCLETLHECQTGRKVLEKGYCETQRQLATTETKFKEAQSKIEELESHLTTTHERFAELNTVHVEENETISQELNQMQTELVYACDTFNKSISRSKSLEERLQGKDKCITEYKSSLKRSRENEGRFIIRNAELKTKTEILEKANDELGKANKEMEKKNETLKNILMNEREMNDKEGVQQQATIGQLKAMLEDAEYRCIKIKEQLTQAENNTNGVQEELSTVKCRYKEKDLSNRDEMQESKNTISQLNREVSQMEEDVRQLKENNDYLTSTNEGLKEKISGVEEKLQESKNILIIARKEKEVLRQSLQQTFVTVFNEKEGSFKDLSDEITKLNGVANVVEQSRKKEGMLTKDSECLRKQLSVLQEEKNALRCSVKTKDEEFEQLCQNNNKLKKYVQKLENELDNAETRNTHLENKLLELKEDLETMRSKESQHHYLYKVLENEKESLEYEASLTQDKVEILFMQIQRSFHLSNEFSPNTKSRIHDDSGVYVDESALSTSFERGPSDSGIFSPGWEKSIGFPMEDGKENPFLTEHNGSLKEAVERSVQIMAILNKTYHERTQLFSEKEENLVNEISVLKQTVNHNNDIRTVLESDVQRLDQTKKSLQEQLEKKNEDLASCHVELRHLERVLCEREKVVKMLNESLHEYKKRQEFLENKLEVSRKETEQEKSERLDLGKENMEYQKICEVLRQNLIRNDIGNQKKITELDTKIRELENQVTESGNMNSQLRTVCTTLRESSEDLNNQRMESDTRISELESHLKEAEVTQKEDKVRIVDLSEELENSIEAKIQLENDYKEAKETNKEAIKQQEIANADMENGVKGVREAKEITKRVLFENTSLATELTVAKLTIEEQECEHLLLIADMARKDELVKNNEAKLKTLGDFLEQINSCKDQMEKEINQAEKTSEELKHVNMLLKKEKASMSGEINAKSQELEAKEEAINQLEKWILELEKGLRADQHAVTRANDELIKKALIESEKIKNILDATDHLLNYPSCTSHKKHLDDSFNRSKSKTRDDSRRVCQQLAEIYMTMETVFQKCQKNGEDQRDLQDKVLEQNQFLKDTQHKNVKLQAQEKPLHQKVLTLSKECSNLESISKTQQQDLAEFREKLTLEKETERDHENLNSVLKEQAKQLEADVASYVKIVEDLRKDRSALKTELLKAQNELSSLKGMCERLDYLKEELHNARFSISELKAIHNKCLMEKEDARFEVEYAQTNARDLESVQIEKRRVLDETQKSLTRERERITTITKVARLKENDLVNAKMALKAKEDLFGQLQKQLTETNEENQAIKKEFSDVEKEVMTVRKSNEALANEKASLRKKYETLEQQQEKSRREKHALEEQNTKQNTKISLVTKSYENQKEYSEKLLEEVKSLRQECNVNSSKKQKLKCDKTKIMKAMESMEDKFQVRYQELLNQCAVSDCKIRDMENSHNQTTIELVISESRKDQLEKTVIEKDEQIAEVKIQCAELQVKVQTAEKIINELHNKAAQQMDENNGMKKSEQLSRIENSQIRSNLKETKENLEEVKTKLAQMEQDKKLSQEEISSGKEIIKMLSGAVVTSEKQLEDIRERVFDKDMILEKMNRDLEFQRITIIQLRDDKSNLQELYRLSQVSEKDLRKDLEDCKLVIEKVKTESNDTRKANTDFQQEIVEQKRVIKDLKSSVHTVTEEKIEINGSLEEARDALQKVNNHVHGFRKEISDIRNKVALLQMELVLGIGDVIGTDIDISHDLHALPSLSTATHAENEVNTIGAELKDTNTSLDKIHSTMKSLLKDQKKMKMNLEENISDNQTLSEDKSRNEGTIKHLEASLNELKTKCRELENQQTEHEKSYYELKDERNVLDNEVSELEKTIFHDNEIIKQISKEISRLTQDKCSLGERMRAVEGSLCDVVKENAVLTLNQEQMAIFQEEILALRSKCEDVEDSYKKAHEEKTHLKKEISAYEEQVNILQRELDASLEMNIHLETQYADESKNNSALRFKVEERINEVVALDKSLKAAVNQVEAMDNNIVSLQQKILLATDAIRGKDEEISRLRQECENTENVLQESKSQIQNYMKINEDIVNSKNEMENNLRDREIMLESSENLLSKEKKVGEYFKNEIENLKLELEATETKLKDKTENLFSQLSAVKTREATVKQELESTKRSVTCLKNELSVQRKKTKENGEKRNATAEELNTLKVNYSCVLAQLEHGRKENKTLHDVQKTLKERVNEMDEKMQRGFHEDLKKSGFLKQEIENLRIQLSASETVNRILETDLLEMQEKSDILRKQKYENQQTFQDDLAESEKNLKEFQLSCGRKDDVVEQVSKNLISEKQASIKLQQNLLSVTENLESAKTKLDNLQQKHQGIIQELTGLREMVIENWKLNEAQESRNKILEDENKCNHGKSDSSKTIRSLRISLESLKSFTDELESNSSKLRQQLSKSEEINQKASIAQIQLKDEIGFLREKVQNIQNDYKSLKESFEESYSNLQKKNVENETMEGEIREISERKTDLEKKIQQAEDKCLALDTEMGVIERKTVTLEVIVRELVNERDNTAKELSTATERIADLQESSNELIIRNSCLLEELKCIENRAKTAETSQLNYTNENKELLQRLVKAEHEIPILKKIKQDLGDEKASAQEKLNCLQKQNVNLEALLREDKEKLLRDVALFQQRIERMENEHSNKDMEKTRLQNQLDEAFVSLERQQSKLSQALSDKGTLRNELLKSEKELKDVMEDNADLNQQFHRNHKNIFSSSNADELSKFRNRISELRRKELALTQENGFLLEQLREKSDKLRESMLQEEESRKEMGKCREKMRRYLEQRDRWDVEVKSVTSQIGTAQYRPSSDSENTMNFFPEKVNNARRKII